jgi:hypothetical protein
MKHLSVANLWTGNLIRRASNLNQESQPLNLAIVCFCMKYLFFY